MGELTRGDRNIEWIEAHCVIPDGKTVGQPVRLTEEQKRWVRDIYDSPTRLFILSMARKNAKTAFVSFLLQLHLCGPEAEKNSQLYSGAQSREQAAILFDYAAKSVRMSPTLGDFITVRDTAKELYCSELGTKYKALSAEATTAYGLNPRFVVHDELGQVKGPRFPLYEALETASGAQENPLSIIISTQAPTDADLLSLLIDDAQSGADPRNKLVLYSADEDVDPFSEEAIRQANPHFDVFMNQEEVLRQSSDAERIPSREPEYRNLILNQRVEMDSPLIPRSVWELNGGEANDLEGQSVYGGLDLSESCDLTALVLVGADGDIEPTFWLPGEGIEAKSRNDRVVYDLWASQGYLKTTPGRTIEYEYIAHYMREVFDKYDVRRMAFDRYNWKHFKPWLQHAGFSDDELSRFVEFGQGYVSMSPAIRELETKLVGGKLRHGMHPVLTMCAANAISTPDPAGNRKLNKVRATGRIDGIVALAMAIGVSTSQEEERPKDYQMMIL